MSIYAKTAGAAAALALMAAPAWAGPPATTPGSGSDPATTQHTATPGPHAGLPAKAKAYGRYCKTESKKRSDAPEGTKGSPFSQCVTAMAKLAGGQATSPRQACKAFSKKHADAVEGTHGSPFSQCVSAGAKLLRDQEQQAQQDSQQEGDTTTEQTASA